jgi:hypothetical protein
MNTQTLKFTVVTETEVQRLAMQEECQKRFNTCWCQFFTLPIRNYNLTRDWVRNLQVLVDNRERQFNRDCRVVIQVTNPTTNESVFSRDVVLPRDVVLKCLECFVTGTGLFLIRSPVTMNDVDCRKCCEPLNLVDEKKLLRETEEYRLVRKYLRNIERMFVTREMQTRIIKNTNHTEEAKTLVQMRVRMTGFTRDQIKLTTDEGKQVIRIEGVVDRKTEVCNLSENIRCEIINLPTKVLDIKRTRTSLTKNNWLLVEIPTLMDLIPQIRAEREFIEIKRQ